jgi:predicted phage baseplate assembly protein
MVVGLQKGQAVALTGQQADAEGVERSEVKLLKEITHSGGCTTLEFEEGLGHGYTRNTVTINANVVHATHGETVAKEVLGSGDGAQPHQRFRLKKPPLTHVSAATASGAKNTLSVRVSGVEWTQVNSLYGLDNSSRSYIVRLDDEGQAYAIFGDGKSGARLPTGRENVVVGYRSGIGTEGEVDAGSLTLLKTRPFGVRSVTNPLDASGAADPETLDAARDNAPLTVLTLDRIVSLRDFEDFCRAFAGIGKTQAVPLWNGESQLVHVTIADANGDEVASSSDLYQNLLSATDAARDPLQEVRLGSYRPLYFDVSARVLIDAAYTWEDIKSQIEDTLKEAFGFEARGFGQPVTAAEVVTIIHGIAGVTAVDLDALRLSDDADATAGAALPSVLVAEAARFAASTNDVLAAQLLMINQSGITLTEMTR